MPPRRHLGRRLTEWQRAVLMNGGLFSSTSRPAWRAVLDEFGSVDECKRAWHLNRVELLAACDLLQRPHAWWWFDAPRWEPDESERPPHVLPDEPQSLRRVPHYGEVLLEQWGLLSEEEKVELAHWRSDGKSLRPGDFL